VAAEIAALVLFPRLQSGRSTRALFALAFGGSALRWLLLWRLRSPLPLVAAQLLHALTFGLFWGAAVRAMGWRVPSRLRATGQALFSAVVFGAGNVVGYQLAGRGYDHYRSAAPLFAWAAVAELLALAVNLALADAPVAPGGEIAPPPQEA
jgi:PPP family 3-phenylpropionic acid transporter